MSVHLIWNTLKDGHKREATARAVLAALGHRPPTEHWDVKLTESAAVPGWTAVLLCPDKTKVAWYFHGQGEDDSPEAVRGRIETLIKAVGF